MFLAFFDIPRAFSNISRLPRNLPLWYVPRSRILPVSVFPVVCCLPVFLPCFFRGRPFAAALRGRPVVPPFVAGFSGRAFAASGGRGC